MRILLIVLFVAFSLAPTVGANELPPLPSQEEPIPYPEWGAYAETVLRTVYAEHDDLIDQIEYEILGFEQAMTRTVDHGDVQIIQFSVGLIRSVRSPEEFALQVGHELGHFVSGHPARRDSDFQSIILGDDPELIIDIVAEELEVEFFAARPVRDGICTIHRRDERNYERYFKEQDIPERVRLQMNIRRTLFSELCRYLEAEKAEK